MAAGLLKRFFCRDDDGTIAPIFGLAAIPLVVSVGAVVDFTNAYDKKTVVQDSMDSAALAAGKKIGSLTMDQLKTDVDNYYYSNVGTRLDTPPELQVGLAASTITLTTTLVVPTYFLGIIGIHHLDFNIKSQATLAFGTLEVAMVLDNSGSMQTNSNIATLRTAATNLTNTIFNLGTTSTKPEPVKMSLVPFAGSVNVGPAFQNDATATWLDKTGAATYALDSIDGSATTYSPFTLLAGMNNTTWGGCVEMRPIPYDIDDTGFVAGNASTLFAPMFAPDEPDSWTCTGSGTSAACSNVDKNLSSTSNNNYRRYNGAPSGSVSYNNYLPDAGDPTSCPNNYASVSAVNTTSDLITTAAAHGLTAGMQIYFDGSALPAPLTSITASSSPTPYYVIASGLTTTAFKVSTTSGGTAVNLTSAGSGTRRIVKTMNWTCANGAANCAGTSNGKSESSGFLGTNVSGGTMCKYGTPSAKSTPVSVNMGTMIGNGGPNFMCTTTAVTPLTTTKATVTTAINAMQALGSTNIQEGMMWGWRTLSPGAPFTGGRSYSAGDNQKILILMTDGENTYFPKTNSTLLKSWYAAWGYIAKNHIGTTSTTDTVIEGIMNDRTTLACTNVKAAGIKVYTVAFTGSGGINATTQTLLQNCASDPSMYYLAADQAALLAAFQAIGDQISLLRISQ